MTYHCRIIENSFTKVKCVEYSRLPAHFVAKIIAIRMSSFENVLFLDADNIPLRDPSFLFEDEDFRLTGAIFWPDMVGYACHYGYSPRALGTSGHPDHPIWQLIDKQWKRQWKYAQEQESGQLLISKSKHRKELLFAEYCTTSVFLQFVLYGDKDCFRIMFLYLDAPFHFSEALPSHISKTGSQHSDDSDRQHFSSSFDYTTNPMRFQRGYVVQNFYMRVQSNRRTWKRVSIPLFLHWLKDSELEEESWYHIKPILEIKMHSSSDRSETVSLNSRYNTKSVTSMIETVRRNRELEGEKYVSYCQPGKTWNLLEFDSVRHLKPRAIKQATYTGTFDSVLLGNGFLFTISDANSSRIFRVARERHTIALKKFNIALISAKLKDTL
mmetsp:Transcript_34902/g.84405  ORF Transcript_34902/g.84405 Transcript_34902/m.84405 type:complete len:383 (+) Transcript_34902:104-1252(+)